MKPDQWKVIMALVRYVLSREHKWVEYRQSDEDALFDALNREEEV